MTEKISFPLLLQRAWQAATPKKVPWIFGGVIAMSGISGNWIGRFAGISDFASPQEFITGFSEQPLRIIAITTVLLLAVSLLTILGRSNLIVSLGFVAHKKDLEYYPRTSRAVWKNFLRGLALECTVFFATVVVGGILAIPPLIAASYNPSALNLLVGLSLLTFVPLAIVIFFIRQFSLLYFLLSPVHLRGAIEVGSSLLYRSVTPSLLFGLFSLVITFVFTFFLNTVILSVVAVLGKMGISPSGATALIGFGLSLWFAIFQQALWIAFFHTIAGPREPEQKIAAKETSVVGGNLPETPPA